MLVSSATEMPLSDEAKSGGRSRLLRVKGRKSVIIEVATKLMLKEQAGA
jgi:hypothetical protein